MTYIRVMLTIPFALMLSLAVALPVTAQTCPSMCRDFGNTALGNAALLVNTTGADNTALGQSALSSNLTGHGNTATGFSALLNNTAGTVNTAICFLPGSNVTTGSHNIHIGNGGIDTDAALIRIGTVGTQTRTSSPASSARTRSATRCRWRWTAMDSSGLSSPLVA